MKDFLQFMVTHVILCYVTCNTSIFHNFNTNQLDFDEEVVIEAISLDWRLLNETTDEADIYACNLDSSSIVVSPTDNSTLLICTENGVKFSQGWSFVELSLESYTVLKYPSISFNKKNQLVLQAKAIRFLSIPIASNLPQVFGEEFHVPMHASTTATTSVLTTSTTTTTESHTSITTTTNVLERGITSCDDFELARGMTHIQGSIFLKDCTAIDFQAFALVTVIQDDLRLNGLDLINLDAFSNLRVVGRRVEIQDNSFLVDVDALSRLESVGTDIKFQNIPLIETIDLSSLTSVPKFTLNILPRLKSLDLSGLNTIDEIQLFSLPTLTSLNGFHDIHQIGKISTAACDSLSLDVFSPLTKAISLDIGGTNIKDLQSFKNLVEVTEDLRFYGSGVLESTNGLSNLTKVGRDFRLSSLSKLSDVSDLNNLKYVGGVFNLEVLEGFKFHECFQSLSHAKSLEFDFIPNLDNMTWFKANITEAEQITISRLADLKSLDGLSSFVQHVEKVEVQDNPLLTDVNDLSLLTINDTLKICNNGQFTAPTTLLNLNSQLNCYFICEDASCPCSSSSCP